MITYEAMEPLAPQENQKFRDESLDLLAEQLAIGPQPGYPTQDQRLVVEDPIDAKRQLLEPGEHWAEDRDEFTKFIMKQHGLRPEEAPLHPWLMDMITRPDIGVVAGRGAYWFLGENRAADPIYTRHDQEEAMVKLIIRGDTGRPALSGGFINGNGTLETGFDAAIREGKEETFFDPFDYNPTIRKVFDGVLADIRVAAHGIPHTEAFHFQLDPHKTEHLSLEPYEGGDDAGTVYWEKVSKLGEIGLHGSHLLLIRRALEIASRRSA